MIEPPGINRPRGVLLCLGQQVIIAGADDYDRVVVPNRASLLRASLAQFADHLTPLPVVLPALFPHLSDPAQGEIGPGFPWSWLVSHVSFPPELRRLPVGLRLSQDSDSLGGGLADRGSPGSVIRMMSIIRSDSPSPRGSIPTSLSVTC